MKVNDFFHLCFKVIRTEHRPRFSAGLLFSGHCAEEMKEILSASPPDRRANAHNVSVSRPMRLRFSYESFRYMYVPKHVNKPELKRQVFGHALLSLVSEEPSCFVNLLC